MELAWQAQGGSGSGPLVPAICAASISALMLGVAWHVWRTRTLRARACQDSDGSWMLGQASAAGRSDLSVQRGSDYPENPPGGSAGAVQLGATPIVTAVPLGPVPTAGDTQANPGVQTMMQNMMNDPQTMLQMQQMMMGAQSGHIFGQGIDHAAMMQSVQQMKQRPGMQQAMQQMLQDPNMLQMMMRQMGGARDTAGGILETPLADAPLSYERASV